MPVAAKLLPPELHPKLGALPPGVQADLLASTLRFEWDFRVDLLATPNIDERCGRVRAQMVQIMFDKGMTLPDEPRKPQSPQSMALVPRRQAGAAGPAGQAAMGPPKPQLPDDLKPLDALFQKRREELSPAATEALERELTRLAKIPSQAAEYGVSKTYCEWLLSLPWKRVSQGKRVDLDTARKTLDDEHEGLQDVKRRVVEYLAVYRLKRDLWEDKHVKEVEAEKKEAAVKAEVDAANAAEAPKEEQETAESEQEAESKNAVIPAMLDDSPPNDVFRDKAPILLLVGPPGVGKTSIARSIAQALGRKFHRISLGGVRDEAEIRGHRRTYVGALPGLFVQALRRVGVSNPVMLLDELDKVGTSNYHGDPSAALLETLDPAQNWAFHDHYLGDVPVDLSQVTFIATANSLDTIAAPLLDRCEVIECSGYVTDEKLAIARRFLLPKQTVENGLGDGGVSADDEVLTRVVTDYTREAGVRSLERELAKLCRAKAVEFSASRDGGSPYNPEVSVDDLETILGMAKYEAEVREQTVRPGVVTGLAYKGSGNGGILLLESALVPGKGGLRLTGSLGDVIKESAELAFAYVRAHMHILGISQELLAANDIHVSIVWPSHQPVAVYYYHFRLTATQLHFPAGAVKKDGPSAGVAILLAFISLLTDRPVDPTIAFTGEITLRGAVTAVGGIREKCLGAHRAGIQRVIMPAANEKDAHDLPASTRSMTIEYARTVETVLDLVWGRAVWADGRMRDAARL